jgi:hypothetical protein
MIFWVGLLEAQETKAKVDKRDFKLKSFCTAKEIINKVKRSTEWEKIFVSYLPDRWLLSRIYKELTTLKNM